MLNQGNKSIIDDYNWVLLSDSYIDALLGRENNNFYPISLPNYIYTEHMKKR